MYQITDIQVSSKPPTLGTITNYYFAGRDGEQSLWVAKAQAVAHVRSYPNTVYVASGGSSSYVDVVENDSAPYLRTRGNDTTSDNLLSLPIH
jgi:hypothetical protein